MSKVLVGLTVGQLALLAVLAARLGALQASLDEIADAAPPANARDFITASAEYDRPRRAQSHPLTDEAALRRIIREELARNAAVAGEGPASGAGRAHSRTETAALPTREDEYAYLAVNDQLDLHVSRGTISPPDMVKLQQGIAKLHPSRRTELLARLNRALNSGDLDGSL